LHIRSFLLRGRRFHGEVIPAASAFGHRLSRANGSRSTSSAAVLEISADFCSN
jgi:hypothetical protein